MASTDLISLANLSYYDSLIKGVAGGKLSIAGQVVTLSAVDGSSLGTITLPEVSYSLATATSDGLLSSSDYTKLQEIAEGATKVAESTTNGNIIIDGTETVVYAHDTFTAHDSGLYKIAVNSEGHVSTATAVTKSDITALGIPSSDTTYSLATASTDGLMSSSDYSKLASIEADADVNIIEAVTVNGEALTVNSKTVNIDLSDYALKSSVTSAVLYKGTVDSYADLPTDASTGDMYNVAAAFTVDGDTYPAGTNVVWNGTSWDPMSGMFTYETASNEDIDALFA